MKDSTAKNLDRLQALLALGSLETAPDKKDCPGSEQLAAFVDGRMQPDERLKLLKHLDECPECYHQWLALAAEAVTDSGDSISPELPLKEKLLRLENVRLALPLAMAASLLVFVWHIFLGTPETDQKIASVYESTLHIGGTEIRKAIQRMPGFAWERPGRQYGFGAVAESSEGSRAFAAGLWHGRAKILPGGSFGPFPEFIGPGWPDTGQGQSWEDTPWKSHYSVGKWSILLHTVCLARAPVAAGFWEDQEEIAVELAAQLAERFNSGPEAIALHTALMRLIPLLEGIDSNAPDERTSADIARQLAHVIEMVSPRHQPEALDDTK